MSNSEAGDDLTLLQDIINDYSPSSVLLSSTSCKQSASSHNTKTADIPSKKFRNIDEISDKIVFNKKDDLYKNLAIVADDKNSEDSEGIKNKSKKRKEVWKDSDDEDIVVGDIVKDNKYHSYSHLKKHKTFKEYLTNKFTHLQAPPKWADLDCEVEAVSDDELLRTIGFKADPSSSSLLPPNIIQCKRLKDLNRSTYAESFITNVQFHPTSTVGLVTSLSGIVSLYAIDGVKNEKLHNINFHNFPIKCAKFANKGQEIIVGSNKKYCYSIDLITSNETRIFLPDTITKLSLFDISKCEKYIVVAGRFGDIHLMDAKSKELIHTYKQENQCTSLQFEPSSSKIISHSNGSEVTIYDIRQQRIQHVFLDDGCISGKTVSISPNRGILATGSNEGVVNIYNYNEVFDTKTPKPRKIIYNLTTSITATKFNHSSELLAISSQLVAGAFKLVHFPSATVFSNFPGQQANIGHVTTFDFSPNSGFMVLGNRNKTAPLYRLKNYKSY